MKDILSTAKEDRGNISSGKNRRKENTLTICVSLRRGDTWVVGSTPGGDGSLQSSAISGSTPPRWGWRFALPRKGWHEDPSMELRPGRISHCWSITIRTRGKAKKKVGRCDGEYFRVPDTWSRGRLVSQLGLYQYRLLLQVFRQYGSQGMTLMVPPGSVLWSVQSRNSRGTNTEGLHITSPSSSLCPGDPRSRWSKRYRQKDWGCWDGSKWVEGDIEVSCSTHSWRE